MYQELKENVKEFSSTLKSLLSGSINVIEDKIELQWPPDTGWKITPNIDPCEVSTYIIIFAVECCQAILYTYYCYTLLQLTKEMLDSHYRLPYPPMIKLDIEATTQFLFTPVPVEIMGIKESRKFILKPKIRGTG